MYDVFKEPTICKLRPSYKLAMGFTVICAVPLLSVLVLFTRLPILVFVLSGLLIFSCLFYIGKYAIRYGDKSIERLRLHNHTAVITYKSRDRKLAEITSICMAGEWILIKFSGSSEKVILDTSSVGSETYSSLRRQINAFRIADDE